MKRAFTRMLAVAVATGLVATMSACKDEVEAQTVALVVGNHQGAIQTIDSSGRPGDTVLGIVNDVAEHPGAVSIIRVDGSPSLVATLEQDVDTRSSVRKRDSIARNRNRLLGKIGETRAVTAQADPLAALNYAADAVRGKPAARITVIDDGLSTTGPLLMQLGLINLRTDSAGLASQLKELGAVSDFTGIDVTWVGLCSTQQPQQPCPAYAKIGLQELWTAVIGHEITFVDTPLPELDAGEQLPAVDPVPFETGSVSAPTATPSTRAEPPPPVLTNDQLRFQSNSNEFVDREQAEQILRPIARWLQTEDYRVATITGCTARDPGSGDATMKARGRGRARAVVRELKRLGATTRLSATSPGWNCPGYIEDRDGGVLVERLAAKNRKIIIKAKPE